MPQRFAIFISGLSTMALFALVTLAFGSQIEARFWPVRIAQVVQDIHRESRVIRFTLVSTKLRSAELNGVSVFLYTPRDRFALSLNKDLSLPNAPCTDTIPLTQSRRVGIGTHILRYCVDVPRAVVANDLLKISVVTHYRGLWGLWDLPQSMPDVEVPADSTPVTASSDPMAAWGD